jgi:hypothetical protein
MKMSDKLKVTVNRIKVHNNGEAAGKGELYYRFDIDGTMLVELPVSNPRKSSDNDVITLNESRTVSKTGNEILEIFGSVSEKDWPSKDETVNFRQQFTQADGWGVGTHDVNRKDGRLDVTVHYEIANA